MHDDHRKRFHKRKQGGGREEGGGAGGGRGGGVVHALHRGGGGGGQRSCKSGCAAVLSFHHKHLSVASKRHRAHLLTFITFNGRCSSCRQQ